MVIDLKGLEVDAINWLKNRWYKSGITNGDILLLHSNIMRTLRLLKRKGFKLSAEIVLESFLEAVGNKGTLIIPLFNFDFTKGVAFDMRSTKSHMGTLTEVARNYKAAVRTGHPIYSFCAIGAQSHQFEGVDNYSGYGADSPFGIIRELDGKIGVLDIEENESMTFHHHVEEMMTVSYRYKKEFTGEYIDVKGSIKQKTYSIFVRDLNAKVETSLNPMGEKLWEKNIYKGFKPNVDTGLRVGSARDIFKCVSDIINCGESLGNLYKIGK